MSNFLKFSKWTSKQLKSLEKANEIFVVDLIRDEIWDHYLTSFPEGSNPLFKERSEHDCQVCRQFVRNCGSMVMVDNNNKIVSFWRTEDYSDIPHPYDVVAKSMADFIESKKIKNTLIKKFDSYGVAKNVQILENGKTTTWNHFHYNVPSNCVSNYNRDTLLANRSTNKQVFERSIREITLEAAKTVKELIASNSIYRGAEFKDTVDEFIKYKKKFDKIPNAEQDNWFWANSKANAILRVRNTALGTILINLSEDMDLNQAVGKFEAVMAPANYKRPTPVITKAMVKQAEKKINELGFAGAIKRRFATTEDITVNNVLYVDRETKLKSDNPFDVLLEDIPENPKKFDKVEEVTAEDFLNNVLPNSKIIEVMPTNNHRGNLLSLVAPEDPEAKTMFKWNNNFSWAYNGDIADSMKQNVKNAGGNVEGVLRFSIQWNDDGKSNPNDLDAHCIEPNRNRIHYPNAGQVHPSTGILDVDIINPNGKVAVENITWSNKNKMKEGVYEFLVHNYHDNGGQGFTAEIEYDDEITSFSYDKKLRQGEYISVAKIEFNRENGIKFIKSLDSSSGRLMKEVWGITTNKFQKVSMILNSPNHWDDNKTGNKHLFFMIDGCKNDNSPRGFFNEFLDERLTEHRKVFEVLGSKMRVEESDNQLSGLGFSSTQNNDILVRVTGSTQRVLKVKF